MKKTDFTKKIVFLHMLVVVLMLIGCTGMGVREPREASIVATFVEGTPGNPEIRTGVEPSHSCIAINRSSTTTTLRLQISANDPNGLESLSIVTARRSSPWLPVIRIVSSSPASRIIRGGGENRLVFTETPLAGEVQISALFVVDLDIERLDTTFGNPAVISFRATDIAGNSVNTARIDLRRVFGTTGGAFACINGTAR